MTTGTTAISHTEQSAVAVVFLRPYRQWKHLYKEQDKGQKHHHRVMQSGSSVRSNTLRTAPCQDGGEPDAADIDNGNSNMSTISGIRK
ncbi:hypothetical protein DTG57_19150 [Salmonella enterica subsp. houtenae]|nr:hypothetical protein [Salmonella enterica subsp. houtenae]